MYMNFTKYRSQFVQFFNFVQKLHALFLKKNPLYNVSIIFINIFVVHT